MTTGVLHPIARRSASPRSAKRATLNRAAKLYTNPNGQLRGWGALDREFRYVAGEGASERRGYDKDPGGGLDGEFMGSQPVDMQDVLRSQLWRQILIGNIYEFQSAIFQPVGGMDIIAKAIGREVAHLIRHNAKVTAIKQDEKGVTVAYLDPRQGGAETRTANADWCICTIPLSILSQLHLEVGASMKNAIDAVPYAAAVKVGLQFKRRFWEEDDAIYGGISYTDLPIHQIGYPSTGYNKSGRGILLGAYLFEGANSFEFTAMPPDERVARAVEFGAAIHPQYKAEFENGIAVAWHRVPFTLGCSGDWSEEARKQHYRNLCEIDGRILLAGEHASALPAWQEGAILSSLDAIGRLHERVIKT